MMAGPSLPLKPLTMNTPTNSTNDYLLTANFPLFPLPSISSMTGLDRRMEDGAWDMAAIPESDYEALSVYHVRDSEVELEQDDTTTGGSTEQQKQPPGLTHAERTLPRNLLLKPSQSLNDVSIQLTNYNF